MLEMILPDCGGELFNFGEELVYDEDTMEVSTMPTGPIMLKAREISREEARLQRLEMILPDYGGELLSFGEELVLYEDTMEVSTIPTDPIVLNTREIRSEEARINRHEMILLDYRGELLSFGEELVHHEDTMEVSTMPTDPIVSKAREISREEARINRHEMILPDVGGELLSFGEKLVHHEDIMEVSTMPTDPIVLKTREISRAEARIKRLEMILPDYGGELSSFGEEPVLYEDTMEVSTIPTDPIVLKVREISREEARIKRLEMILPDYEGELLSFGEEYQDACWGKNIKTSNETLVKLRDQNNNENIKTENLRSDVVSIIDPPGGDPLTHLIDEPSETPTTTDTHTRIRIRVRTVEELNYLLLDRGFLTEMNRLPLDGACLAAAAGGEENGADCAIDAGWTADVGAEDDGADCAMDSGWTAAVGGEDEGTDCAMDFHR